MTLLLIGQCLLWTVPLIASGVFPCGVRVTTDISSDAALLSRALPSLLLDRPLACSTNRIGKFATGSGIPLLLYGQDSLSRCQPYAGRYQTAGTVLLVNRTDFCPDSTQGQGVILPILLRLRFVRSPSRLLLIPFWFCTLSMSRRMRRGR